jgi:hypothetical protein
MADIPNTEAKGTAVVYQGRELIAGITCNESRQFSVDLRMHGKNQRKIKKIQDKIKNNTYN